MTTIKKYAKEYTLMTTGDKDVNLDFISAIMIFIIFVSFLMALVFRYDVTINIVWFLGIILGLVYVINVLIITYMRFHSLHIFAPHFSWSAMMTNIDSTTIIYDNIPVNFTIIPLMGAISRGFIPIPGGGKHGFLVADSSLLLDLEGNVAVYSDIFPTRVEYLPKELRARVMTHHRFKGNPKKVKAYFAIQPYGKTPAELQAELQDITQKSMGNLRAMIQSLIRENNHLNALLNSSLARERFVSGKFKSEEETPPQQ
jgi:hypothetical protein